VCSSDLRILFIKCVFKRERRYPRGHLFSLFTYIKVDPKTKLVLRKRENNTVAVND
jgi:hypothetical protein